MTRRVMRPMTRPVMRRVLAAAALASGAVLLAACGSTAAPAAGSPTTKTVTAQPSTSTSSVPAAGSSPSKPAVASCATSQLKLGIGQSNGTAGSVVIPLQFRNASSTACSLYGYPGVSFVTGVGGSQIGASAGEDPAAARMLVTVAAGSTVHALLQVTVAQNFPAAKCKLVTAHWLKVFPPGQTAPLYQKYTSATCSSPSKAVRVLNVQTVLPGGGNP
jgi:hypothetical protein